MRLNQFFQDEIGLVIDQEATGFYLIDEDPELLQVDIECGKNVNMIPGDAGNNRDMREKKMEFWPFFDGAGRVFIPLAYDDGGPGNVHGLGKTLQTGPDQPVKGGSDAFQHMHD